MSENFVYKVFFDESNITYLFLINNYGNKEQKLNITKENTYLINDHQEFHG